VESKETPVIGQKCPSDGTKASHGKSRSNAAKLKRDGGRNNGPNKIARISTNGTSSAGIPNDREAFREMVSEEGTGVKLMRANVVLMFNEVGIRCSQITVGAVVEFVPESTLDNKKLEKVHESTVNVLHSDYSGKSKEGWPESGPEMEEKGRIRIKANRNASPLAC
jgi:hypothetical protein